MLVGFGGQAHGRGDTDGRWIEPGRVAHGQQLHHPQVEWRRIQNRAGSPGQQVREERCPDRGDGTAASQARRQAVNDTTDLARREADLPIRSFRPTQPDLLARKVKDGSARLYASLDYLAKIGNPTTAEKLSRAQFLGFDRGDAMIKGLNALGLSLTPESVPVISGNQLVQWELPKRGVGISIMLEELGDAEPKVPRARPDFPPFPVATWLTTHRDLSTSRHMRVAFELLIESLRG